MRRIEPFGSVKAISLDRAEITRCLREVATSALVTFPHVCAVYLIGSLTRGSHSGTSDVDLLLWVSERAANSIEAVRPYFFFSSQLDIGIDLLLCDDTSLPAIEQMMEGSILLASRDVEEHPEHQVSGSEQTNSSEGQAAG
mgnify:FL=1